MIGNPLSEKAPELLRRNHRHARFGGPRDKPRGAHFAGDFHASDGRVANAGVPAQRGFNLNWFHQETADVDSIVGASENFNGAVWQAPAKIARSETTCTPERASNG